VFIGSIAGLLAIIGFVRRRPGAGLARGTVIFLVLFFSVPPFQWLVYNAIPKLNFVGGLGRTLFVWVFAVAILAGLGLDATVAIVRRRSERWTAAPDDASASDPRRDDRLPWERWSARSWRRLAPAARRAAPAVVAVSCVALTAAQLFVYMRDANPPFQARSGSQLFPDTPAVAAVRQAIGPAPGRDRVLPLTGPTGGPPATVPLVWATSLALDLPSGSGYESALPTDTADLWRFVAGESLTAIRRNQIRAAFGPYFAQGTRMELLGRLGIAAVLTEPNVSFSPDQLEAWHLRETYRGTDGVVFEVLDRPRRAFLVDRAARVDDPAQALERLVGSDFDPRREVILDDSNNARDYAATRGPAKGTAGRVRWLTDSADELRLEVRSEKPAWLVVLDSWDPGWSASIDSHATDVVRADYNFRAVRVPAGTSTIRMSYEPPGLVLGAVISGVTVGLIVAALVVPPLRRYVRRRSAARNQGERRDAERHDNHHEHQDIEELVSADDPPAAD
jgi:Bacterial membrane protein YfhO